jgi:4-hydroxy-tetrahydrodipicolinate synthase
MIHGAIASLVTPFTASGALDRDAMAAFSARMAKTGFDAICFAGGTGEFLSLTEEERAEGLRAVVAGAAGKPVLAAALHTHPKDILGAAERAARIGAKAILVLPPYFYAPDQASIVAHLSQIGRDSALPVVLFNSPGRGGVTMSLETIIELAASTPNFIGIKETTEDMTAIAALVAGTPSAFEVIQAYESLILPSYVLGANGSFGSLCNLIPKTIVSLHRAIADRDLDAARALTQSVMAVGAIAYSTTIPVGIKHIMRAAGIHGGDVRIPLTSLSLSQAKRDHLQSIVPLIQKLEA